MVDRGKDKTPRKSTHENAGASGAQRVNAFDPSHYRQLLDKVPAACIGYDRDGTIVLFNEESERLYGYNASEIIGRSVYDTIARPEDVNTTEELLAKVFSGNSFRGLEWTDRRKNGAPLDVISNMFAVIDENGVVVMGVSSNIDITDWKRAQADLSTTHLRLKTLLDNLTHVVLYETGGGRELVSDNIEQILGYPMERFTRDRGFFPSLIHPDDLADISSRLKKWHEEGESGNFVSEFRCRRQDGAYVWLEDHMVEIKPPDAPKYMCGVIIETTERRRSQESLRESEEKYRLLVENMQDGLFIIQDEKLLFANKTFAAISGYEMSELIGKSYKSLVAPEHLEMVSQRYNSRQQGDKNVPSEYEFRLLCKDGATRRVVNMTVGLIKYHGRLSAIGTVKDVTEKRQAERAIRDSEERFRRFYDASFEGMLIHDRGKILDANKAFADMIGCELQEIIGKPILDFIAQESRDQVKKDLLAGYEKPFEAIVVRKDKSRMHIELQGRIVSYMNKIVSMTAVRDLTERKNAEAALARSEEMHRTLVTHAEEGIGLAGLDDRFIFVNPKFAEILGYAQDELISKHLEDIIHPDEKAHRLAEKEKRIRGDSSRYETVLICKDGSPRRVILAAAPLFDDSGKVYASIGILSDITEQKKAENDLRESKQMLTLVMDNIPQFIFWKDVNSVYSGCNRNFVRVAGIATSDDIVGKTDYDLAWTKEESDFYRMCDRRVMDSNTPEYHIIEPQLQADGKNAWLDTCKVPLHDAEGNVVGILGTYEDITERMNTEAELRESRESYRSFFDNAQVGMFRTRLEDGKLIEGNARLLEMFGVDTPDEYSFTFTTKGSYADPKDREKLLITLNEKGFVENFETRFNKADGTQFWGRFSGRLNNEKGFIEGVIVDITEERGAIDALKSAEERHKMFIRLSSEAIWRLEFKEPMPIFISEEDQIDHAYKHAYFAECNNAMAAMHGLDSAEDIVGTALGELMISSNLAEMEFLRSFIRSSYRLVNAESQEINKEGEIKYFLNNLDGVIENGKLVRAWGTQRDITEWKNAQRVVAESEERYRTLVENTQLGVFIVQERIFQYVNPAFSTMFGYDAGEIVGSKGPADIAHPEIKEEVERLVKMVVDSGIEVISHPFKGIMKNGGVVDSEVWCGRIDYMGRHAIMGILKDVSNGGERSTDEE